MSLTRKYQAAPVYPTPINEDTVCRNGQRAPGRVMRQLQQGLNSIIAFRRKVPFAYSQSMQSAVGGASGTNDLWRFMFRTGYGVEKLVFEFGLLEADSATAADPYVAIGITPVGGSEFTTQELHYNAFQAAPFDTPDRLTWGRIYYRTSDSTPLLENTEYEVRVRVSNYARVLTMVCHEQGKRIADTSDTAATHARNGAGSPIIDEDFEHMMEAQTAAWKKNGAHVFTWVPASGVGPLFDTKGGSDENLWDTSVTGVSASNPNIKAGLQYHNSSSQTTVPVKMAVYGQRTAGAGTVANNKVIMEGLSGGNIEVTGIGNTAQWYTATGTWAVTDQNFILSVNTDAADTIRIDSVCLWEDE